jgi:hypothetical protein
MSTDKSDPNSDEKWGFSTKTRANMGYLVAIVVTAYAVSKFCEYNKH